MRIVVFGATGNTGQAVVAQALEKGHEVTAFARNPDALPIKHDRLRVATGDTTADDGKVEDAIRGQDVVVSALGRRNSLKSERLIERSLRAIVPAMERTGVRRIVVVSAFGVGESRREAPLIPGIMYRVLLSGLFADKKAAEDYLRASGLDWSLVYPVLLTDGPLTGTYRVGERLELSGIPKIARADVAHFIVAQLANTAWVRKVAVISY